MVEKHCLLHHQHMTSSSSRHRRRHTLVPVGGDGLSEGVLVADGDRTVLEVVGGPPFAELELVAAHRCVGRVTLDRLGAGSVALTVMEDSANTGSIAVALYHGGCPVLEGHLSSKGPAGAVVRNR